MRYRLRTLLIWAAVGPPLLAGLIVVCVWLYWLPVWSAAIDGVYVDDNGKIVSTSEPPPENAAIWKMPFGRPPHVNKKK
jgi:hypothetical protein